MQDVLCPQLGRRFPPDDEICLACIDRAARPIVETLNTEYMGRRITPMVIREIKAELDSLIFDCCDDKRPVFFVTTGDKPEPETADDRILTTLDPSRIDISMTRKTRP